MSETCTKKEHKALYISTFDLLSLFPDSPPHNHALPLRLRVLGGDRTGSHCTCRHPPLPPRDRRFRPSRRSLFFRDRRFRAPPARDGDSPHPADSPRPSVSWAGLVRILSRPRGPWEGRLTSDPGRGGSGRGSREPASASATATCSRAAQGLSGTALTHPELGRPQKDHTLPQNQKTSPRKCPAGRSPRPGTGHVRPAPRVRAPPLGRSRRAPGHLAAAAVVRRRLEVPAFFPGRSRSLLHGVFPPPHPAHPPFQSAWIGSTRWASQPWDR